MNGSPSKSNGLGWRLWTGIILTSIVIIVLPGFTIRNEWYLREVADITILQKRGPRVGSWCNIPHQFPRFRDKKHWLNCSGISTSIGNLGFPEQMNVRFLTKPVQFSFWNQSGVDIWNQLSEHCRYRVVVVGAGNVRRNIARVLERLPSENALCDQR
jgi:hypothetical protein